MNELIEELYKQSFIEVQDENSFPCMTFSKQKFAELIVWECEQVSLKNSHRNDDMGAIIARQIKQHFGVEE